ncbi:MAG: CD225/dispanin family protein [Saprospiraceae bacterium]|nr:CD225/dispanin family protein [Saprospiraceae bacterium]
MLDQPVPSSSPKTWLAESILATFFCCLPFGIVGIVNAANVESRFRAGDYDGAERASQEARKWTMISFWIGVVGYGLYALFMIGMLFFVVSHEGQNF